VKFSLVAIILLSFVSLQGYSQKFVSLIGFRGRIETVEFSSKIALSEYNYLEGTLGVVTPQPDYTIGAGVAYHRHINLSSSRNFQFYYGAGLKAVIGDESGFGAGPQLGLIALFKRINLGIDVLPTYFFIDALEFQPLFGVHLRWVNY